MCGVGTIEQENSQHLAMVPLLSKPDVGCFLRLRNTQRPRKLTFILV